MKSDILKWDGSDLTSQLSKINVYYAYLNGVKYLSMRFDDKNVYSIIRSSMTTLQAIIDESKPLFGLTKLGTHIIYISNKIHILIKPQVNEKGCILQEITLNNIDLQDIENKEIFTRQVKEIYAFREIMAISKNTDSGIIVRKGKIFSYPVSYYEPNVKYEESKSVISENIINKWFPNDDFYKIIINLINVHNKEKISSRIFKIQDSLEKIILRIDKSQITYLNFVLSRIRTFSQYYFS